MNAKGQFQKFQIVTYAGERGSRRVGEVRGYREGKVIVLHNAGHTVLIEEDKLTIKPSTSTAN